MTSTIGDLQVWARALATGTLLTPGVQAERLQFGPTVGPESPQGLSFPPGLPGFPGPTLPVEYGLGMFAAGGYLGHNGSVPSHEAMMLFDPNTGTLIVELQNARVEQEIMPHHKIVDVDAQLPNLMPSAVAGILGQDPPLPPDPANAGVPHCAPAPAAPVSAVARFTG
jgi:D-alanyl-D-alanine carboxypeptidase